MCRFFETESVINDVIFSHNIFALMLPAVARRLNSSTRSSEMDCLFSTERDNGRNLNTLPLLIFIMSEVQSPTIRRLEVASY